MKSRLFKNQRNSHISAFDSHLALFPYAMDSSKTLNTRLGQIRFSVAAEPSLGDIYEIELRVVEAQPTLPPGMSVQQVQAILLRAYSPTGFERLDYRCQFMTDIMGEHETGQHLDALSWYGKHDIVVVGTEDGEALIKRMPWLWFEWHRDPLALVRYQDDGLNVPFRRTPAGATIELHYIVAENSNPEPVECSAWFAVDIPHSRFSEMGALPMSRRWN